MQQGLQRDLSRTSGFGLSNPAPKFGEWMSGRSGLK
jgi:hypothetical protein